MTYLTVALALVIGCGIGAWFSRWRDKCLAAAIDEATTTVLTERDQALIDATVRTLLTDLVDLVQGQPTK